MLSWEDEKYTQAVITYTEARNALARARIARGFCPVVVPADTGGQPRFGRTRAGGNCKSKGQDNKPSAPRKPRPKHKPKGQTTPTPRRGTTGPTCDFNRPRKKDQVKAGHLPFVSGVEHNVITAHPLFGKKKMSKATESAAVVFRHDTLGQ